MKPELILIFVITFFFSLLLHAHFGRYTFYYSASEVFTKSEINESTGKRFLDSCFKNYKEGTITGFNKYGVEINYDQPILGKYKQLTLNKESFKKCIVMND